MRNRITRTLPLLLAAILQIMPMLRSLLPLETQGLAPSTWAIVLKLATGAVALFGYDAISSASSISISPVSGLQGVPYNGTITYSGGHAGSVSSWNGKSNTYGVTNGPCQGVYQIAPGLFAIPGAGSSCTVTGTPSATNTFSFSMTVHNSSTCGGDSDSRSTSIAIGSTNAGNFKPAWTLTPVGQVAQLGSDTILSAGALGKPTAAYRWSDINGNLVGTNSSILLTNIQLTNAGIYTVQASNSVGNITTNAYLSVISSPSSLLFHFTNYLAIGLSTNLSCYVSNVANARTIIKWQYNGGNLVGQTGTNFVLTAGTQVGVDYVSGTYGVAISSYTTNATLTNMLVGTLGVGSPLSSIAPQGFDSYWIFGNPPTISQSPTNQTVSVGDNVTLTVVATGDAALPGGTNDAFGRSMLGTNYQWYSNSVATPLAGQTGVSLTLNAVTAAQAGNYFVIVTNVYGAVTSTLVLLTVNSTANQSPTITNQPQSQIVAQGATVQLSVTAGGIPTPSYVWNKGGSGLIDGVTGSGSSISGSTGTLLTINNAQPTDSGNYTVGITNIAGGTNSTTAQVLVVAPATNGPQLTKSAGGGQFNLSFTTLAGYRYIVQSSTNLTLPSGWVDLTNIPPAFSDLVFNFSDLITGSKSFYRTVITNQ